ncbi:aldehyde dehydrogenase family protein [Nocardia sp. NPDC058480]|uniref:aldehyde dehydrogenase family protein n=1 Tax=unclassified Nocardia TaxID=2637762 RepID=UPI0036530586
MGDVDVWSLDPRTGARRRAVTRETDAIAVDRAVKAAHAARGALNDRSSRANFLRNAAEGLAAERAPLAAEAEAETALGLSRLHGEIDRTCGQLRAFADLVEAADFLDIIIDHADTDHVPPRPDLRRYKVGLGVVAVYSASNFPFAFSIAGGDTASALAAGCPVVVKAHPGHPATSALTEAVVRAAAAESGLPADVVRVVHGFDAGVELIRHPLVAAAGFTGSQRGGRALFDAAAARERPIPFHGELGSLNPVVVTAAAAAERGGQIGRTLAASVTLGHGQFCVKPGLVLVPEGPDGDALVTELAQHLATTPPAALLDQRMLADFTAGIDARANLPHVQTVVAPRPDTHAVSPALLSVPAAMASDPRHALLLEECFGPVTVVARYAASSECTETLSRIPGALTATAQLSQQEAAELDGNAAGLLRRLSAMVGRVVVNDWPTGVAVTAAQHHGGPYPASTSTSTSVGSTAIERWLRPVAYQNTPEPLLPQELQDANPMNLSRLVDGVAVGPGPQTQLDSNPHSNSDRTAR